MRMRPRALFARNAYERDVPVAGQRDPEDRGRRLAEGGASAGDGTRRANDSPWRSRCMRLVPDAPCGPVNRALLVYDDLVVEAARDLGERSVKSGIEADDLRHVGEPGADRGDRAKPDREVQRRERDRVLERGDQRVVD